MVAVLLPATIRTPLLLWVKLLSTGPWISIFLAISSRLIRAPARPPGPTVMVPPVVVRITLRCVTPDAPVMSSKLTAPVLRATWPVFTNDPPSTVMPFGLASTTLALGPETVMSPLIRLGLVLVT